jgi:protein-S-isoprenylcysteine O-methyltransferase Ste14
MIGEFAIDGVYLSSVLVSAVIALAAAFVLRRVLSWAGAYRFVWHPALFDTALFVILWAVVVTVPSPLKL